MGTFLQDENCDLVFESNRLKIVEGIDHAAIKIRNRLLFYLGEYFLDTRLGLPYFQNILLKNPNLEIVKGIFSKAILSVSTITNVQVTSIFIDEQRKLHYTFIAKHISGGTITGGPGEPYIITQGAT